MERIAGRIPLRQSKRQSKRPKGKSKNKEIMHLIRMLHYAAAVHGFAYEIRHIRGVDNTLADVAARKDVEVCCFKSPFYA
jgi:hypothetical protein